MANVYLYDVDDLKGVVDENVMERRKEADKAEEIVDEEIETFLRWQSSLDAVPAIVALREKAEGIKRMELDKLMRKNPEMSEAERSALEQLASGITNKLIHPPTAALKEDTEDKDVLIALVKRLYGIEGNGR